MPDIQKGIDFLIQKGREGKLSPEVKDSLLGYLRQTPIDPSQPTAMFQETIDKRQVGQTPVQPMGRIFPKPDKSIIRNIARTISLPNKLIFDAGKRVLNKAEEVIVSSYKAWEKELTEAKTPMEGGLKNRKKQILQKKCCKSH
jgi:hypothetical protein